jgi:hypothetical protein
MKNLSEVCSLALFLVGFEQANTSKLRANLSNLAHFLTTPFIIAFLSDGDYCRNAGSPEKVTETHFCSANRKQTVDRNPACLLLTGYFLQYEFAPLELAKESRQAEGFYLLLARLSPNQREKNCLWARS